MYQRRRTRLVLIAVTIVALILVTLDVRAGDSGMVHRARGLATAVLQPVQDGIAVIARPVIETMAGASSFFAVRRENEQLRQQVEILAERRRTVTDLERENQELRRLLLMQDRGAYDVVAARAVIIAPSSFEWTITIDVGSDDGVERDMPVVNGDGLVGRVVQVTPRASRVLLAIDPSFFAAARTARTGQIGPIEGRGGDPMIFRPLDPSSDIATGDEIVTSSYQGGVFPGGIPIGLVADAGQLDARLVREITVRPFVDFTRLHHVLVVLSSPVEPIPPLVGTPGFDFRAPDVPRFHDDTLNDDPISPDEDEDGETAETTSGVSATGGSAGGGAMPTLMTSAASG